ncbi:MAG: DUF697 domain-containing protein [Myxococcota bacterium]
MSWLDTLEDVRKRDWSSATPAEREAKAKEVINICGYGACLGAVVPIPLADLAILLPVHSGMVMTVGHIYGRPVTQAEAKKIALELGAVAGLSFAGAAAISAIKRLLLPIVGGLMSIPATFALTWGLGRAAMSYFSTPNQSREELKRVFEEALKEGKSIFSPEAFEKFRARHSEEKPGAEKAEAKASTPPAPSDAPPKPVDESVRPKKRTL